jgi:Zn-dependent protease
VSFALSYGAYGILYWLGEHDPHAVANSYGGLTLLGTVLLTTYSVNWWLGVFNSLPIFPLDGGQFVYNGLLVLTKRQRTAASLSMFLAFVGAALFLSWQYTQLHTIPMFTIAMFAVLLWQAYSYLR